VKIKTLAPLLLCAMALAAADDPFVGTWKLNPAKSKFEPGPAPQSETVNIGADGKVSIAETDAKGQTVNWSYTFAKGGSAPITGLPDANASVMETRKGNTVDHTWNIGKTPSKGHGVVSKDGKTLTYTLQGEDANGKKMKNTEVYEKQ
jgi:hypothetical protein